MRLANLYYFPIHAIDSIVCLRSVFSGKLSPTWPIGEWGPTVGASSAYNPIGLRLACNYDKTHSKIALVSPRQVRHTLSRDF